MQIYKVGGAVRDRLLGRPVTERDWVVVGASAEEMIAQGFRPVGADFPVFLHPKTGEEYALARTERKSGCGYGGFTFYAAPDVTLEQDLLRRDLTINAMAEDAQGRLIDPYGGQADLAARVLRHVAPAFAEDPLRVLRVARFAARYHHLGFTIAGETLALMRQLAASGELTALTAERCWKEIARALMEPHPQVFLQTLHDCGALVVLLPELEALFHRQPPALLARLDLCARQEQPLPVRWACALLDVTGERIDALNGRLKVPRDGADLALLAANHRDQARNATHLPAAELLALLQSFDVYRRPERFEQFLAVCRMDAGAANEDYPQANFLQQAAAAVRTVAVQPLIAQGFQGAALGEALKGERLRALQGLLNAPRAP